MKAALTTVAGLFQAIQGRLGELAAGFELESKTARRAPSVIGGWLPPKVDPDVENFPFLIVRPKSGADSEQSGDQNATAVIEIIIGTFSDTDDGWLDVVLLIDAIRADLDAAPVLVGTAYEHIGPLTWQIQAEQPRPQWFGTMTTNWQIPRPTRVEARNPIGEG